uniref:EGF-like domain-containing protein n=1 Tax=Chromera velia CCMP2878 TaxID=1169474 RepID=A0A0G4HC17_9ALVE|eukprot:Cvel_26129.t1-p1 / transcript=Cvel_26129.t1 / gene=Cvel_26129 / organism=Chromera_velia_CCMP2878 / gene_product=hypothetical protein / transcript_product=hypothetical protein / location=Cvel_scaffold3059:16536-19469(-) / protein_length=383 / sequence_SO=supercontig / SO=protein_coding / is_pseudo=false
MLSDFAYLLGSPAGNELDECAAAVHNCHSLANCTDTPGSFICACNSGFGGNGVTVCGVPIPPADIGRGDHLSFTWTKDEESDVLYNGHLTIYKDYGGEVCPGEYRVYANDWWGNTGNTTVYYECLLSSLFDGSTEGWPWASALSNINEVSSSAESAEHIILKTPCYITLAGYAWQSRSDLSEFQNPSAMNVSGSNSTDGPWTTLHSFDGVSDWTLGAVKKWATDVVTGPFRFFRFTVRRVQYTTATYASGAMATLYAASITELDECAVGVYNCDIRATCSNTNGSFTYAYNSGFAGDGLAYGIQIPPADIGRGDSDALTWSKDTVKLYNGFVTMYTNYGGAVCPGEYSIFSSHDWYRSFQNKTINLWEYLPSALFDGSPTGSP